MSKTSYKLSFLPEEDRLVILLDTNDQKFPNLLMTRRLTKLLCNSFKNVLENRVKSFDYDTQGKSKKEEIAKFEHQALVDTKASKVLSESSKPENIEMKEVVLVTRIDFKVSDKVLSIMFYNKDSFLVNLTLGWDYVHLFLHAISKIATKAQWDIDSLFNWVHQESTEKLSNSTQPKYLS